MSFYALNTFAEKIFLRIIGRLGQKIGLVDAITANQVKIGPFGSKYFSPQSD